MIYLLFLLYLSSLSLLGFLLLFLFFLSWSFLLTNYYTTGRRQAIEMKFTGRVCVLGTTVQKAFLFFLEKQRRRCLLWNGMGLS